MYAVHLRPRPITPLDCKLNTSQATATSYTIIYYGRLLPYMRIIVERSFYLRLCMVERGMQKLE